MARLKVKRNQLAAMRYTVCWSAFSIHALCDRSLRYMPLGMERLSKKPTEDPQSPLIN